MTDFDQRGAEAAEDRCALTLDADEVARDGEVSEVLWDAATVLGPVDGSILDLHLRHGFDTIEVAELLGERVEAAGDRLVGLRGRFGEALRARLLWRDGEPECVVLAAALAAFGIEEFGAAALRAINMHSVDCRRCGPHGYPLLPATELYAALPMLVPPASLARQVARALARRGVPMRGSFVMRDAAEAEGEEGGGGEEEVAVLEHRRAPWAPECRPGEAPAAAPRGGRWDGRVRALAASVVLLLGVLAGASLYGRAGMHAGRHATESVSGAGPTRSPAVSDAPSAPPAGTGDLERATSPSVGEAPSPAAPSEGTPPETMMPPTTVTVVVPEPSIVRFDVGRGEPVASCSAGLVEVSWLTRDADRVELRMGDGAAQAVGPRGRLVACLSVGGGVRLDVSGPGGSVGLSRQV